MKLILENNLKDYILHNIPQEKIFSYYLGISEADIIYCLDNKSNKIRNPLRDDRVPSLGFMYNKTGKLYMKDFANPNYNFDIFSLVGFLHNLNSNNKYDFPKICNIIIDNIEKRYPKDRLIINKQLNVIKDTHKEILIQVKKLSKRDIKFWNKFSITINNLYDNFVYPISDYWIEDTHYDVKEIAFAYYLGRINKVEIYKLYFPNRQKHKPYPRFITNNKLCFECLWELRNTPNLIITKSRKDVMVWKNIIDTSEYSVISLNSESSNIPENMIKYLNKKYKNIIIDMDNDEAGKNATDRLVKEFETACPLLPYRGNRNHAKDISDSVVNIGYNETKKCYEYAIQSCIKR